MNRPLGVAIMAFNRPWYFRTMLASLADNDLSNCEFHLFQDGAVCKHTGKRHATDATIEESIQAFLDSPLPAKSVHVQEHNVCCAEQRAVLMPFMAEKYERFIQLDDDIIFSPNYITVMRKLLAQFENDADNPKIAGAVSPAFSMACPQDEWEDYLDAVRWGFTHFWANGYWSRKWRKAEPHYMEYYDKVSRFPYRELHVHRNEMRHWARTQKAWVDEPSSDSALLRAIWCEDMDVLRCVVNRATGIGEYGLHSTPELLSGRGEGHQPIYSSPKELEIETFRGVGEGWVCAPTPEDSSQ